MFWPFFDILASLTPTKKIRKWPKNGQDGLKLKKFAHFTLLNVESWRKESGLNFSILGHLDHFLAIFLIFWCKLGNFF